MASVVSDWLWNTVKFKTLPVTYSGLVFGHTIGYTTSGCMLKGTLSGLRQFLAFENALKMMEYTFYFT